MDASTGERMERGLKDLIAAAEQAQAPELEPLMAMLGQRLISADRLAEAADLVNTATARGLRLDAAVARRLAQAQMRSGDTDHGHGDDPRRPEA